MPHRLRSVLTALLIVPVFLAGCGDGDGPTATSSIEGTYTLQQVNGVNLPATIYEDPDFKFEILSGSLILTQDRRYREPISFRFTDKSSAQAQTRTEEDTGSYSVTGSTITFVSADADVGTFSGTVGDNTISYTFEGINLVYRR